MNQELTDKHKKPTPWISAFLCFVAAIAGPSYGLSKMVAFLNQIKANREASNDELNALFKPIFIDITTVIVPILIIALLAGILNIYFVTKGGRKWTLIISSIGILISIAALGMLAFSWMNMGAKP